MLRRDFLNTSLLAAVPAAAPSRLGIPGPFRGRVVAVHHPDSVASGEYQPEPIQRIIRKGMTELTGARDWVEAWGTLFKPGDVVGIKVNPGWVGAQPAVLSEIRFGLGQAGVRWSDIIVFDRYKSSITRAGYDKALPGIKLAWAAADYDDVQLGMDGYDPDHYVELPIVKPGWNASDPHVRRCHVARFLTREVNKLINLAALKHHASAGVTLALKNMAYGMANNVKRSHQAPTINACGIFIPAILDLPVFRQKAVLQILDGVRGGYDRGPGIPRECAWEHKTMYFATDPVALDKVGWRVIDEKRVAQGLPPVAQTHPKKKTDYFHLTPEHIEIAGELGLGEFDDAKIELKKFSLA